ncbi:ABC transporter ATP-binding protein [Paenibacillus sp. J5C2022]|uniref:ABC transporter ATP-binding protein n=1 Tax=Paenibacillus sp. J5C2022 TaxID=2977129 RepID=UPI00293F04DF|nr:ABC transporter ATP-binding protein [Paenibacillus sp. J5C2022]
MICLKLSIEQVHKQYGRKKVLQDICCELTEGVYGFLGANGSGKTTLMRILAAVSRPTKGHIRFDGADIGELDDRYRELIGYLPQQIGLYRSFTVMKFLLYIAALKGIAKDEAHAKAKKMLEWVGMADMASLKMGKLSGGQKQRVGIAQALLNDPHILIVDEPTAGLDPKERIRFRNLLATISQKRIVLLSTHIVSDIEYIAKEILVLKQGRLIEKAEPRSLLDRIRGSVWVMQVSEDEVSALQKRLRISSIMRQADGSVLVRVLSLSEPDRRAEIAEPNLEDLYLHYFDEEAVK